MHSKQERHSTFDEKSQVLWQSHLYHSIDSGAWHFDYYLISEQPEAGECDRSAGCKPKRVQTFHRHSVGSDGYKPARSDSPARAGYFKLGDSLTGSGAA